jgi:hypothetical protein
MRKLILSLCDRSGNWPSSYMADSEYGVMRIDVLDGGDIRLLPFIDRPVHGILAAPPCTHFASSGACWWEEKGDTAILEGMQVADACLRMVAIYNPVWWALENPVGRLRNWLGPWSWAFDPREYGGYLQPGEKSHDCEQFPANDGYTKKTCIWGTAIRPSPRTVAVAKNIKGNRYNNNCFNNHKHHRSVTPLGFARAFYEANR